MKSIYKITALTLIVGISLTYTSCVDILEMPESSSITIDTVFSNKLYAMSYLATVYQNLVPRGFPYGVGNPDGSATDPEFHRSILAGISDECSMVRGATWGRYINTSGFTAALGKNYEDNFCTHWSGIRAAYTFIDNIDRVPESEIATTEKEQMKAETKTLIAVCYSEMIKRYGGVPIVTDVFDASADSLKVPRSSYEDCVNFIVNLCDEAAKVLPSTYTSDKKGRVTKGVALACKAQTLLHAASPQHNCTTADLPLPYDHPEFLCYGNYDKERWLKAAEAANDVLVWAKTTGGARLITAADIEGGEVDPKHNAYGYATSVKDNDEIILANKGYSSSDTGFSDGIYFIFTSRGCSVMQGIIEQFRKADGSDQSWPTELGEKHPFTEYSTKMREMEPRFYQCCWPAGQGAPNFSATGNYASWPYSSITDKMSVAFGTCPMVKFCYNYTTAVKMQDWIVYRLGEFYLDYAEAVNEYYGPTGLVQGSSLNAIQAVNVIRERGQLRDLNSAEIASQDVLREQIRRERAVELFAEGHRNFDCRRWKIADDVFGSPLYTMRYVVNSTKKGYDYYYRSYSDPRMWTKAMNYYPFPQAEVDKGYLVQNPGY